LGSENTNDEYATIKDSKNANDGIGFQSTVIV